MRATHARRISFANSTIPAYDMQMQPLSRMRSLAPNSASFLAFALTCMSVSSAAHAVPIEEFTQLAPHPSNPALMALGYKSGSGGGLFYTRDGGQSWQLMCSAMIAIGAKVESAPVTLAGDGSSLVGAFDGAWQSPAGCGWSKAAGLTRFVTDFAVHPTDSATIFAVTGTGGDGVQNGIFRRDATGAFNAFGAKTDTLLERIRVTARSGGGLRFYETGQRQLDSAPGAAGAPAAPPAPMYVLRVSDDDGMTWTEQLLKDVAGQPRLEAVDPTQPDRVVLSVERTGQPGRILVSKDKGATFTEYLTVTQFAGVTMANDGRIWVADRGDPGATTLPRGLWAAPNLDTRPSLLTGDRAIGCVKYQPATDTLYVCARQLFPEFGTIDLKTGAYKKTFDFFAARDFLTCPGVEAAMVCKNQLCGAYCGLQHYARAPLCNAYTDPTCGPMAALIDRQTGWGITSDDSMTMSVASAGSGAAPPSTGTNAMGSTAASMSAASAPPVVMSATPAPPRSGGCAVGGSRGSASTALLSAGPLALLITIARRARPMRRSNERLEPEL